MVTTTTTTTSHIQPKRKSSVAGLATGGRTVKRRASKACHCCRGRKVRCDVVESGIPCTNCRLDEVECVVTEGKRRRKTYSEGELLQQSPSNSVEDDKDLPTFPLFDDIDELNNFLPTLLPNDTNQVPNEVEDEAFQHKPHLLYQTQGHRLSKEERTRRMSVISCKHLSPALPLPTETSYFSQQPTRPEIVLPAYIQPISPRIMLEDLEFLQKKGAFLIPETALRNELLRCYVQYVHPFLPIIDLQDFLGAVEKNQPTDTVSLLLIQAVMFAGTGFIDMRFLLAQGYMTRKAARKAFFEKVKVLYDFDYELNRVTVVQAVLLMTYWYESPDDPKDIWHWLGIATSVARTIGINCDTSNAELMTTQQRRLWKRIWWSCYTRDRLIALGMRRPMRIKAEDFDVSMVELSDFETEALSPEVCRLLGGCPTVKDSSKRITLANMCIGLVELCHCITQVITVQYSILGHKIGATQQTTVRLIPKTTAAEHAHVTDCDREFEQWHQCLPQELHYFTPESSKRTTANDGEVIHLHRALLTGIYLTAISALHRPQILPSAPDVVVALELRDLSKRKVREAADEITDMYKELFAQDMIRYLPNTGVTCLLPAIIIHLLDVKSSDSETRQASIRKFQSCMQALQRLREMYASADFAFSFLDAAVRKQNAQLTGAPAPADVVKWPVMAEPQVHQTKKLEQDQLLLTPPPEAMQTASLLLLNATLAPEERKMLSAYTPKGSAASSDASLSSYTTAGAAVALDDLPEQQGYDINGMTDMVDQAHFDSLVDLEGGADLFSTADDDMDLSMQWLKGFDGDKLTPSTKESGLEMIGETDELDHVDEALDAKVHLGIELQA